MEISNAGTETSSVNKENLDQSAVSPVPDLVTNVPDSTTKSTSTATTTTSPATVPAKSGSPPNSKKDPPVPAEPSVDVKSTPQSAVKSTPTSSQPTPIPAPPRATSLPSAASEASVKNRGSREEKSRKKDDKSVDHVLRALNSLNTTEEKLAAMCKKYADLFDEHRKLQVLYKQTDKKCGLLQREKELLQADHSKAILTRSRLENLCRELQRQNKAIKDESLLKIREEEEKRKEVSAKFQATMNEITTLMQQNNDNNMKLRDDNIDMTSKLKSICEQYEVRQQQVETISKQMQLEQQLAEAKMSKLRMEMSSEREVLLKEKQQLLLELQQYQQRCKEFQNTEVNLRSQISMYNDKYDEFQKALARSNDVFGGFKGEMEKMSKKICKLEKETSSWKQRWERSHNALLEMAADKQRSEQELSVVSRQLVTLQGLCRTLQTERASLMAKLRGLQAVGLETLDKTAPEKCTKQCEQSLNCLDQPANHLNAPVNHLDQPANHIVKNDPVLVQYNQDILASFKEAVEAEDSCNSESVQTECTKPSVPVPTSPLPDVVGVTTTTCISEKTPDVNSVLCERLEGVSLNPSAVALGEKASVDQNTLATSSLNAEANESPDKNNPTNETSTNQHPTVENPTSQVVLNGGNLTNGLPTAPLLQEQIAETPESSKSPVKGSPNKSSDNAKKTKEPSKKKKK